VPEISRFYGIIISLFFNDHNPPHFHIRYGSFKAIIRIKDFLLLEGNLPPRALGLVMEWAARHQNELLADWDISSRGQEPPKIEPLD